MSTPKYATAILSLAVVILTALTAAASGPVTLTTILQLAVLALGGVITYIVPILDGRWKGGVKTGVAVVAALVSAVIPLVGGGFTWQAVFIVVLAGVQALATQLGVAIRVDAARPTVTVHATEAAKAGIR